MYSSTTLLAITSIVDLSGNSTSITGNSLESSSGTNLLGELKIIAFLLKLYIAFAQATALASRKAVKKHRVFHLEKCSKVAIIPLEKCNEMGVIR